MYKDVSAIENVRLLLVSVPRCGALTTEGKPCRGRLITGGGRCYLHSGHSRGVSPEGQARQAAKAREVMTALWARWRVNGKPLSAAGRRRISEAQRERWQKRKTP